MFDNQQRKFKRSAKLISVLTKYGFKDLLGRLNGSNNEDKLTLTPAVYLNIRLALEELGPTFVKLGQSFSDRDDLLPQGLAEQLSHLQDNVKVVDLNIKQLLKDAFGEIYEDKIAEIQEEPIAAASIAQVYKAKLKNGKVVIIKVKRPGIDEVIKDDLLILKDIISLIDTYTDYAEQLNLKTAVLAFEKSLAEELSLANERENILKFRQNFAKNKDTYVPKVYKKLCNDHILTMEFVDGIKITDIDALTENDIDLKRLAEVGYRLFVSQILEYGFFHADPHAGNLLVTKKGQLVFIDFGAVGVLPTNDKPIFENLILSFVAQKAAKIVRLLKKLAIHYSIPDERKFEADVLDILTYVHGSSLSEISVPLVMDKMRMVLKENRLVMPEYFYLLFKAVSLMDGVGRKLNPDLNVVKSLKPFTQKLLKKKLDPQELSKVGVEKGVEFLDHLEEIPEELRSIINKLDDNKFTITTIAKDYNNFEKLIHKSIATLSLCVLLAAIIVATAILFYGGYVAAAIIGTVISVVIILVLTFRGMRRN